MDLPVAASLIGATALVVPPPLAAHVAGTVEGSWTLTVSQSCEATWSVFCTSAAEQALATQHEMPLMKEVSAQIHLTSRLQLVGRLFAHGFYPIPVSEARWLTIIEEVPYRAIR